MGACLLFNPESLELEIAADDPNDVIPVPDGLRDFDRVKLERKARYLFDHPHKLARRSWRQRVRRVFSKRSNAWPLGMRLMNWLAPASALRRKLKTLRDPTPQELTRDMWKIMENDHGLQS